MSVGKKKINWWLILVSIIVGVAIVYFWHYSWTWIDANIAGDQAAKGQFGDMFGAVNSLFSGLAFAGLLIAIFLQHHSIQQQRKEYKLALKEFDVLIEQVSRQNYALDEQIESINKQNFGNIFFQMVSLHHEIVKSLTYKTTDRMIDGRICFQKYYTLIDGKYSGKLKILHDTFFDDIWDSFSSDNINNIDQYFRNLHKLLDIVDKTSIIDRKAYTDIIRAQLSGYELIMIFYYGIRPLGGRGFKELLEKYGIFEDMDLKLIIHDAHFALYNYNAFGEQSNNVQSKANMNKAAKKEMKEAFERFMKKRKKTENLQSNGDKDISDAP
ncbi:MAG: putative phage abortive infection protein [FCB group bacterium]|nr:putative phage abortive infection protein [FCB group bacterium]